MSSQTTNLLLIAGLGVGGYYLYKSGALSGLLGSSSGTPTSGSSAPTLNMTPGAETSTGVYLPVSVTVPSSQTIANPAIPATSSLTLGDIYARMQNAAMDAGNMLTAAQWAYMMQTVSAIIPPPMSAVFGQDPGTRQMRLADFWGPMSQYLVAKLGMSGLGRWRWAA